MSEQPGAAPGRDDQGVSRTGHDRDDEDLTVRVREQTANDLGSPDAFGGDADTDPEGPGRGDADAERERGG